MLRCVLLRRRARRIGAVLVLNEQLQVLAETLLILDDLLGLRQSWRVHFPIFAEIESRIGRLYFGEVLDAHGLSEARVLRLAAAAGYLCGLR